MITHIKFVSIPVRDQDLALAFYADKLGFEVLTDHPFGNGKRWIELGIPGAETRLVLFTPPGQEDRIGTFSNMVFSCDDVEKTYQELKQRGVPFKSPPAKASWGTSVQALDPDGNQLLFSSQN